MKQGFFLFILTFTSLVISAQTLLPVRLDGKWGYIDKSGNWVIQPIYDEAFEFKGTFAKVIKDDKCLVVNIDGQETQIEGIERFDILDENYILFKKKGFYGIADYQGNTIISPNYSRLEIVTKEPMLLKANKLGQWGLIDSNEQVLAPFRFRSVSRRGFILTCSNKDTIAFYSIPNKKYFPPRFKGINVIGKNISVRDETGWRIFNIDMDSALLPHYETIVFLSDEYALGTKKEGQDLIHIPTGVRIDRDPIFFDVKDNALLLKRTNSWSYFEGKDERIKDVDSLNWTAQSFLQVHKDGRTNYYRESRYFLPWEYTSGRIIEYNLIECHTDSGSGLYNQNGRILDDRYFNILLQGNRLRAVTKDRELLMAELDSSGITDQILFKNYRTLFAKRISSSSGPGQQRTNNGIWFRRNGLWGLMSLDRKILLEPQFTGYRSLENTGLAVVYKENGQPSFQIDNVAKIYNSQVSALVNESDGNYLMPMKYTFIDLSTVTDSSLNVIRAMSLNGMFETVEKGSGRIRRYRATYMDKFHEGKARVYIKGHFTTKADDKFRSIGTIRSYLTKFNLVLMDSRSTRNALSRRNPDNPRLDLFCVEGQWTYIDRNGEFVKFPVKQEDSMITYAENFKGSCAIFERNKSFGILDSSMNDLHQAKYSSIRRLKSDGIPLFDATAPKSKYRFYAKNGEELIKRSFQHALAFDDRTTWVKNDGKYFLLRENGQLIEPEIIPHKVSGFNNGVSAVRASRKWQLMNDEGLVITDKKYSKMRPTSEGMTAVARLVDLGGRTQVKQGYLNDLGEETIPLTYLRVYDFKNGYAKVLDDRSRAGLINTEGQVVIPTKFQKIEELGEGHYRTIKGTKRGAYSSTGDHIFREKFSKITFGDGTYATLKGKSLKVFDSEKKPLFRKRGIIDVGTCSEGLIAIKTAIGWGYYNLKGRRIIDHQYAQASEFNEGYALVGRSRTMEFIDTLGNQIDQFRGKASTNFVEGFSVARTRSGEYRYISSTSEDPFGLNFQRCRPFENQLARVCNDDKWGVVNNKGIMILPEIYDRVYIGNNGTIMTIYDHQHGLLGGDGTQRTSISYDEILNDADREFIKLTDGNEPHYYSHQGNWIWKR